MKRLLEDSLPPRAATLLRSAAADVPPRAAAEKARLVSAVAGRRATPDAGSRVRSGRWLGALSLVVAVSAGVTGSRYFQAPSSPAVPTVTRDAIEPKSVPSTEGAAQENAPSAEPPKSIDVMDLPSASAASPPPRVRMHAAAPAETARASAGAPSLEDELAAVDQARAAFVGRDPVLALARVESYRQRFPAGRFMDEAAALEIQALVALERNDEARSKAARFLAERPASPYAQRVRSAVGFEK